MVRKPQIIQRLEALKGKVAAMPLIRKQIALFIALTAMGLACASTVQMIPDKGLPQAASSGGEWLTQVDHKPKFEFVPPQPKMPDILGEQRVSTKTTIEFYVDERGKVNPVLTNIKESSGYEVLDKIALEWAKKITFHPGIHQGKPVNVKVSVPIQWMSK